MAETDSDRFTATMSRRKREGRIFLDWLRNDRGATAIPPYSLRAREGLPVAVPVTWDKLGGLEAANAFTMGAVRERLADPCSYLDLADDHQRITEGVLKTLERWRADG